MEPRPPVSLDGAVPDDPTPDVLDSGSGREPLSRRARRRLRLGGLVAIVTAVAVVGGLEVKEQRDAAAEERRLAGLLRLSSPDGSWGVMVEGAPPSPDSVEMPSEPVEMLIRVLVRNDGPRGVTVTQASAGGFVYQLDPVPLPAQTTVELVLQRTIRCSADMPPPSRPAPRAAAPGPLEITAMTQGGSRSTTIARSPYYTEYEAAYCEIVRNPPSGVTLAPPISS